MEPKIKKEVLDDEPGAEERFERILGRALTTPPKRKTTIRDEKPDAKDSKKK